MSSSVAVPPSFFWAFFDIAMLAFVSFVAVYVATATAVFHQAHGNPTNWEALKKQLQIMLLGDDVRLCRTLKCVVIQSTIAKQTQEEVLLFVGAFPQIEAAKRRVLLLHAWGRFVMLGLLLGVMGGFVLASPALFGYPPLSARLEHLNYIVPAVFLISMYFLFVLPQNRTWTRLQTYVTDVNGQLQGNDLEPPTW